jgi:hypothetical protein
MTWARIDDQFRHHPKVVQAGPLGIALHVCGLSYTAEYLTDGFIPRGAVNTLCDFEGVWFRGYAPGSKDDYAWTVREVVADLVALGMWDEVEGGYQIHDYLDYNPSREKVLAERAKKQAAGKAGGKASAEARAQASAQAESKPVPVPKPIPEPVPEPFSESTSKAALRSVDNNPNQPTHDQLYLAGKLDDTITPAVIVKLNKRYGVPEVCDVLRSLRDFKGEMVDPVAYVTGILNARQEAM